MLFLKQLIVVLLAMTSTTKGKPKSLPECPPVDDIFPCRCTMDTYLRLKLDCSLVENEQQLLDVFSQEFPFKTFHSFFMYGNRKLMTLPEGVFGQVTFAEVLISQGILEVVEPMALIGSASTLKELDIGGNRLMAFPFEEVDSYEYLDKFFFDHNKFEAFPRIVSSSLKELDFAHNPLCSPTADSMKGLSAIEIIYMYSCMITEIPQGTFTDLPNLSYLTLADNLLTELLSHSFELHGPSSRIFFTTNNISSVANDSISGVTYFMNMSENNLVYVEEGIWRPLLENGALLALEDNPLACGCDLAWLVRNDTLLELIYDTNSKCSDGTPIQQLDPLDFESC